MVEPFAFAAVMEMVSSPCESPSGLPDETPVDTLNVTPPEVIPRRRT